MRAIWNGQVVAIASKDDLIYIERNWYFPPESVNQGFLRKSDTPYNCPWKGDCQYFDVGINGQWSKDSAWSYPEPLESAIKTVKQDFSNYVAFWHDVQVVE